MNNASTIRRPWYRPSLTTQIFIGLILGGVIGYFRPDWGNAVYFLRDIFLNLIKSIIAPLVFSTIVVGIAGAGALKKVGRMGAKALIYFEIVTTAALFIGLAIVNLTKPGIGVTLATANTDVLAQQHNARVGRHLILEGKVDGVPVGHFDHGLCAIGQARLSQRRHRGRSPRGLSRTLRLRERRRCRCLLARPWR